MEQNPAPGTFPPLNLSRIALALALMMLAACAAIERPPGTVESLIADGDADRNRQRRIVDGIIESLARRALARKDGTLDVLLLSGGGQHGAYGMGFLRGWRSRSDSPMPRFDLVTGISTGALQAPFALLATEQDLAAAAELYREAAIDFAPTFDWLFWLRRTGGVLNTTLFKQMIESVFDAAMCRRLREEFDQGRQLALATTDLNLGIGRIWDIARETACSEAGLARAHTLLLATTAIPGIFPPMIIDGRVHSDGGLVANLLPVLDLPGYRRLAGRLRALGVTRPVTVRLWVVMNLWTHPTPVLIDPSNRGALAQRGSLLLFWTQQSQIVARLAELARAVSSDIAELNMEMRYTAVPSEFATEPGANTLFDREWMLKLENFGYERARGPAPWDEVSSPYERPAAAPGH